MVEQSLRLTKCFKIKELHLQEINNVSNAAANTPLYEFGHYHHNGNCMLSITLLLHFAIIEKISSFCFRNNQDSLHIADWFYIEFIT